ncbi:MAG TPA: hypothetical protein HPQ04_06480 [Rhodospirillaceae bacterium]|nr:hypothetical protein [Rhodospirillaceae bacterium]
MFKQVLSAMTVSAVLLTGTAFAAEQIAAPAAPSAVTAPTGKTIVAEKKDVKKVTHKHEAAKAVPASTVTSEPAKTVQPAAKVN